MARQPDSKAVAEARAELARLLGDLRGIKSKVLAVSRRMKRAARTGEVIGKAAGKPYTVEDWLADSFHSLATEAALEDAIGEFVHEVRDDPREMARYHVKETLEGELV